MKRLSQMTVQGFHLQVKLSLLLLVLSASLPWMAFAAEQNTSTNASTNAVAGGSFETLRPGDRITVVLSDVPAPGPYTLDRTIAEDGSITLHLDKQFQAAGKSRTQLEKEIKAAYVPNLYVRMNVAVKQEERFFYVSGRVRVPNRYLYSGEIKASQAIATSGGFDQFARRTKVEVTRAATGKVEIVDVEAANKNPKLDITIYPGDRIYVPESPFGIK